MMAEEFEKEAKAGLTSILVTHLIQSAPTLPLTTSRTGYPLSRGNVCPFISYARKIPF
jgi:hypothetical protein